MIFSILLSYLLLGSGGKTMSKQSWVYDCFVATVMHVSGVIEAAVLQILRCYIRALAAHKRLNESIFFFASNNYFCLILTKATGMTKSQIRAGLEDAIPVWKSEAKRLLCNVLYKHTQKEKTSWHITKGYKLSRSAERFPWPKTFLRTYFSPLILCWRCQFFCETAVPTMHWFSVWYMRNLQESLF